LINPDSLPVHEPDTTLKSRSLEDVREVLISEILKQHRTITILLGKIVELAATRHSD
jgi:hypothetical protein